jgi:hypothetical protein
VDSFILEGIASGKSKSDKIYKTNLGKTGHMWGVLKEEQKRTGKLLRCPTLMKHQQVMTKSTYNHFTPYKKLNILRFL